MGRVVAPRPELPAAGPGWVWSKEVGYDLPDEAYREPINYDRVTDAKAYRDIMLNRNGEILAVGWFWKIVGQDLGHSLVRVSLVRKVQQSPRPQHPHPVDGTHEGLARDCETCLAESVNA